MSREYRKPEMFRIESGERKLYQLETRLKAALKDAAEEWGRIAAEERVITEAQREDFYHVLLPQALFDLMDGYDIEACIAACQAYLEKAKHS